MAKPGRREDKPSTELRCFTDRDDQRNPVRLYLNREVEPPVVMFYGVGGAGKTSLLKRLREELPGDVPSAYLDFDPQMAGQRCAQLGRETPRFDLAFAMLRHKRGGGDEPGMRGHGPLGVAGEIAAEVAQAAQHLPGVNVVLNQARKALGKRLKNTALERLLASAMGSQFVLKLRTMTAQEIGDQLLPYLADDLREAIPPHLNRAVRAVLFLDTFEAVSAGLSNEEQRRIREHWIRELPATLDFALVVLAGQNRLDWDEAEPDWRDHLDQHLVGGLSEIDARQLLRNCGIDGAQADAILSTAKETDDGGYHCFSLGLCADAVHAERRSGREPEAESLRLRPQDWEALARRFLKSLASASECRWIERLAVTPRFDEHAARAASSPDWDALHDYSFVNPVPALPGRHAIRAQMRWALENQPSAKALVVEDHRWWREYWRSRSQSPLDDAASLAWRHRYHLESGAALEEWDGLAETARTDVPP